MEGIGIMKNEIRDVLYIHLHASERFVIFSGMTFREFVYSYEGPLPNLLLLKHGYDDGEFNMNTLLEFVPNGDVEKLLKDHVYGYGDFCWIDFEEEAGLDELNGQEIAELLYVGHCKTHLRPPFFGKLNNQFVYLAHDDGWFNKVYFRNQDALTQIFGNALMLKLETLRVERSWFGLKKKREYPEIPFDVLQRLIPLTAEGVVFSLQDIQHSRTKIEIPGWIIGDYVNMDDMMDGFNDLKDQRPKALIVLHRKTKEWSVILN